MPSRATTINCDCNDNLTLAASLRDPAISAQTRKAIQVVLMNYITASFYDTDLLTTEEIIALDNCCCLNKLDQDAVFTYILWQYAITLGDVTLVPGTLINQASELNHANRDFDGAWLQLICQMFKYGQAHPPGAE